MKTNLRLQLKTPPNDLVKALGSATKAAQSLSIVLHQIDKRTRFEKFYDSVSNFLSGGKSFLPKELKSY